MKTLTILFGVMMALLLTGVVLAGGVGISIAWDKATTDTLKTTNNIKEISLNVADITCDKKECWSWVSQDNLINTEWRTSLYDAKGVQKTLSQLTDERNSWIQNRIKNYASVQDGRSKQVIKGEKEI